MQYKPNEIIYDKFSPIILDAVKFILLQDPIKIALGSALGFAIINLLTIILNGTIKPLVSVLLNLISDTGFKYIIRGATFDVGNVIEQVVIFIIIILLLYYCFALPITNLRKRYNIEQKTASCPYCTTLINASATKCPACTSILTN